jgi:hypothetical protein
MVSAARARLLMCQLQRRPRTAVCKSIQEAIRKEDMVAIRKVVCFGDHPC